MQVVKDAERCLGGNGCKNSKHMVLHAFFSCKFSAIMISGANSGPAIIIKNELDPLPSRFLALDDGSSSFPDLVCVCVCVFLSSSRGELPSDAVPTARQIHPPQRLQRHTPRQTPHQPLPEEMLADGCPLGNVDGTATANFVGTIPWSPSDIPPSASLCET